MITGQQATDIAMEYLRKSYNYVVIKSAKQENNKWILELDVGVMKDKIMRLTIDVNGQIEKVEQVK